MKFFTVIVFLLLSTISTYSQDKVDSLIQAGIECFNLKNYQCAAKNYSEALSIEPTMGFLHLEAAKCYKELNDTVRLIKHCNAVINLNSENVREAMLMKGIALNDSRKSEAAIKLFEEAIARFGADYELNLNLAASYYYNKDAEKAAEYAIKAILLKPTSASAHLLLGCSMLDVQKTLEARLALYYFLLLEPNTERAGSYYDIIELFNNGYGSEVLNNKDYIFNIYYHSYIATVVSFRNALHEIKKDSRKRYAEFVKQTKNLFSDEINVGSSNEFHSKFYFNFFKELVKTEHYETFCRYITQGSYYESEEWVKDNPKKLKAFIDWISNPKASTEK